MRLMYAGSTPCKLMTAFAAAGLLFSVPANAEPKIGVVNVAKLLDESPQARSASARTTFAQTTSSRSTAGAAG